MSQKKDKKKKARDRQVQLKLRQRREKSRLKLKEERQEHAEQKAFRKVINQRVMLEQWVKTIGDKLPEDVRAQVERNVEILKSLEDEYEQEMQQKKDLQEELKADGHETLDAMLTAMQERSKEASVHREIAESCETSVEECLPISCEGREEETSASSGSESLIV